MSWQPIETVPLDTDVMVRGGWFTCGSTNFLSREEYRVAHVIAVKQKDGSLDFYLPNPSYYEAGIVDPVEWHPIFDDCAERGRGK